MKFIRFTIVIIWSFCFILLVHVDSISQNLMEKVDSGLVKLVQLQQELKKIHPLLESLYPVAVVENDSIYIFDYDSIAADYIFIKKDHVPFPMGKGIRASFPLSVYDNIPSCVVSPEVFDSLSGYPVIFHEFIHCGLVYTSEQKLKSGLNISLEAMRNENYSWELTHPFPYDDSLVITMFGEFITSLKIREGIKVKKIRSEMRNYLNPLDFEYMVWEEWKEGFARLIENKIQAELGLGINNSVNLKSLNRVSFYFSGSEFINFLIKENESLFLNSEQLFETMLNY